MTAARQAHGKAMLPKGGTSHHSPVLSECCLGILNLKGQ
ncbi:MAG: hypothetical protein ACI90E_001541, partial [Yoonia sp.]